MLNKLKKEEMSFIPENGGTCAMYKGIFYQKFSIDEARKCYNLWRQESYKDVVLTKVHQLYESYERKGTMLIGKGECIGSICYFSGKAYRGMGAMGCSKNRTKGIGLLTNENLMFHTLKEKGLVEKTKPMRYKGLTSNEYNLVCKVEQTIFNPNTQSERTHYHLTLGLLGEDNSFVDLNTNWSTCLTENFK